MKKAPAIKRSLVWLAVIVALLLILIFRLQLSFDLAAFLPRHGGAAADVLLQQLGRGPGSRIMVLGISGGSVTQRGEASRALQSGLSESSLFVQVLNGEAGAASDSIPEPIHNGYPLMTDLDYRPEALAAAFQARLQDLALAGGRELASLVAVDPYLASLELLQQLAVGDAGGDLWQAADGSSVLLAETRAGGTDLAAQATAMQAIRQLFAELQGETGLKLEITGVGPFGVELQQSIRAEATLRSCLASLAVVLVLLLIFRSFRMLLLVAVPVTVGFLAGLAAVSLVFDQVHGITLAFGITLLGVVVDFPIHFFTHQSRAVKVSSKDGFWRTLWLGASSTALAYLAMIFSGASGLAQLGLFSAVGVLTAMCVTHSWLPALLPASANAKDAAAAGSAVSLPRLQWHLAALAIVLAGGYLALAQSGGPWDDRLSALSPVSAERVAQDRQLRSASASFDMRYQIQLEADSLEQLLQRCEQLQSRLTEAVARGLLADWSAACMLLPSLQTQEHRLARIPEPPELQATMQAVLADSMFNANAFQPFEQVLQEVRAAYPLTPEDFASGPLAAWLAAHLLQVDGHWFGLVNLAEPHADELAGLVSDWGPEVAWVDLQQASQGMMQAFRLEASRAVAVAALAILLMLMAARTRPGRLAWIGLTAASSLIVTIAVIIALHGAINLVHLVALLLVLGLGLDYSLFLSREDESADTRLARRSVLACALSTTLAFGVLALSIIPMLSYIGLTVAVGSLSAFLLAVLGSWQRRQA
jgi:predicted exporter